MKKIILICMLFMFIVGTGFLISIAMKDNNRYEVIWVDQANTSSINAAAAHLVMYDKQTGDTYSRVIPLNSSFKKGDDGYRKWNKFLVLENEY